MKSPSIFSKPLFVPIVLMFGANASPCTIPPSWHVEWPQKHVAIRGFVSGYAGPFSDDSAKRTGWGLELSRLEDIDGRAIPGAVIVLPTTHNSVCTPVGYLSESELSRDYAKGQAVAAVVIKFAPDETPVAGDVEIWTGSWHCTIPTDCQSWEETTNSAVRLQWFVRLLHNYKTDSERARLLKPALQCWPGFDWKGLLKSTIRNEKLRRKLYAKWLKLPEPSERN